MSLAGILLSALLAEPAAAGLANHPGPSVADQLLRASAAARSGDSAPWGESVQASLGPQAIPASAGAPDPGRTPASRMQPYAESVPGSRVRFDMLPIPAGSFCLGSPPTEPGRSPDEGPQRVVSVEAFWMGRCEVTWNEYDTWVNGLARDDEREIPRGADAIAVPSIGYVDMSLGMGRGMRPAAGMSQLAAKLYCRWLTAKTGRYYRLPTEAEWEYACRAGSTNAYAWGEDARELEAHAWYEDNSEWTAQPVGRKRANAWGLHDMHGNLAEWVVDGYHAEGYSPDAGVSQSWPIPATEWDPRCVRGGSFDDPPARLRCAARRASSEAWRTSDPNLPRSIWWVRDAPFVGFRLVRPLRVPAPEEARRYDLDAVQVLALAAKMGWTRLLPPGSEPRATP